MVLQFKKKVTVFPYCQLYKTWNTNLLMSLHYHHLGLPAFLSYKNYCNSLLTHAPAPFLIPPQFTIHTAAKWSFQRANQTSFSCWKPVNGFPLPLCFTRSSLSWPHLPSLSSYHSLPRSCWNASSSYKVTCSLFTNAIPSTLNFTSTSISLPSLRSWTSPLP